MSCRATHLLLRNAAEPGGSADGSPAAAANLASDATLKELSKWVDLTAVEYVGLYATREVGLGRPAAAIEVRRLPGHVATRVPGASCIRVGCGVRALPGSLGFGGCSERWRVGHGVWWEVMTCRRARQLQRYACKRTCE